MLDERLPGRIRAIPTRRDGIEFRSKLEADFAACLTACGAEWVYEPEGLDFSGVRYLPDFWLPRTRQIVEVKGLVDDPSVAKPRALSVALNSLWGEPPRVVLVTSPFVERLSGLSNQVVSRGLHIEGPSTALLCLCHACRVVGFMSSEGEHVCAACGHYQHDEPGPGDLDPVAVMVEHTRGRTTYQRAG